MAMPDSQKTVTQSQSDHSQEVHRNIYGQLVSMRLYLDSVALDKPEITLGRSLNCDVVLNRTNLSSNYIQTISSIHFKITCISEKSVIYITDLSKNGTYVNSTLVGKGKKKILNNNDLISIGTPGYKVYKLKNLETLTAYYLPLELKRKYEFERPLGSGACGEVVLVRDRISQKEYAVKKINKGTLKDAENLNNPLRIKNEVKIMESVSHPCIISTEEVVETDEAVFIVLEYMSGGELTDLVLSKSPLPESVVKLLFYQLVLGLRHLHLCNITHRDLKPGNILLQSKNLITVVKIADFGLSKIMDTNSSLYTCCGTPCYIAPEIIDPDCGPYTQQVDVWSLGVILFYMLSGELPFQVEGNRPVEVLRLVRFGAYSMKSGHWNSVSFGAKDLIQKMLIKDPQERYTIHEVANHPWLAKDIDMQQQVRIMMAKCRNENVPQEYCDECPPKKLKLD